MDALTNPVVQAAMEALVNLWFGVNKAEYSVKDEAPVALVEWRRESRRSSRRADLPRYFLGLSYLLRSPWCPSDGGRDHAI
jgi:hypothetical protein